MNMIKGLKDVISILQKSNDIEMINKVIDIQQRILEMEDTIIALKEENRKLKDKSNKQKKIVRYKSDNIVTLKGNDDIYYCSKCWDDEEKLIQVLQKGSDFYECPKCKTHNYFYGKEPVIEEEQGEKIVVV